MATFVKTPSGTWKALIRRQGWPATRKTFRTKRDAEDWARRTEDEMVRGVYIRRTTHERTTVADALDRYEREVVPLKKASTQAREDARIREVKAFFGKYSLAAVSPDLVAEYRDKRQAQGKANNTVCLELALLGQSAGREPGRRASLRGAHQQPDGRARGLDRWRQPPPFDLSGPTDRLGRQEPLGAGVDCTRFCHLPSKGAGHGLFSQRRGAVHPGARQPVRAGRPGQGRRREDHHQERLELRRPHRR